MTRVRVCCDAALCRVELEVPARTIATAREMCRRHGWVTAHQNRRVVDFCPSHINWRTRQ